MLGALAAIALAIGVASTTAVLTEDQNTGAQNTHEPVVEVQAIESVDTNPNDATDF
jgi:hypothetical protein